MLQVNQVTKHFGAQPILREVTFTLNAGERVGLVGPNGCGKSTLLRLIAGLEPPDAGQVQLSSGATPGYLAQALPFAAAETVAQVIERATGAHARAWAEMQRLAQLMAEAPAATLPDLTAAYGEAEARFEAAGGYELETHLQATLTHLALDTLPPALPVEHLSGGQKTRLALAGLLVQQPRLLLLDEPTNHLDQEALAWLESWLTGYEGALLVASHDRVFLDTVTTRTLAIDPVTQRVEDVAGNYSAYLAAREQAVESQWQAYQAQQEEMAQLRRAARQLRGQAQFRRGGKADTNDKFAKAFFANRSAGTMGRAKQIERRLEYLETEGRVEKPTRRWQVRVDFGDGDFGARRVLALEDVSLAFDEYPLLRNVNLTLTHGERIALTGPNGSGKSSLLRLIAGELPPAGGVVRLGSGVQVGYLAQEQDTLASESTPLATIQAAAQPMDETELRRFLHHFLFAGDEVFTPVGRLSFGERTRLMLAQLVAQNCNLLLLDEPVNHMDIASRERFETALLQFNGTLIAAAHDRAFIERVATGLWEIAGQQVRVRF